MAYGFMGTHCIRAKRANEVNPRYRRVVTYPCHRVKLD
jgi:hypothetical protein